jgi:manganese/zinc/iron transport system permease protein
MLSATSSAIVAAMIIDQLEKNSTLKKDTILGVVLATSFGLGTIFLSKIQTIPDAHQAGLTKYLLGNASTLLHQDLAIISMVTALSILFMFATCKQYKTILFDHEFAKTTPLATRTIKNIVLVLTTLTIVIGLQTVGVILMSALLIAPASAARQWSNNFEKVTILSSVFAMLACVTGTIASSCLPHTPTGPIIVIIASGITFFSILFAPNGTVFAWWKKHQLIKNMNDPAMLSNFLLFNEGVQNPYHAHDLAALQSIGKKGTKKIIASLADQGLIVSPKKNFWQLTPQGLHLLQQNKRDNL